MTPLLSAQRSGGAGIADAGAKALHILSVREQSGFEGKHFTNRLKPCVDLSSEPHV